MSNLTFTMIKPEAVEAGNTGAILKKIENGGFRIVAMKKVSTYQLKEPVHFMMFIKKDHFMVN